LSSPDYFRFDKSCTIYCADRGDKLFTRIKELAPGARIEAAGSGKAWTQLAVTKGAASITLNRSLFVGAGFAGPAKNFNKIILGTGNFFKDVPTKKKEVRQKVLDHIYASVAIIGCVGEPNFANERGDYRLLFGIARFAKGMVFDGQGMLDSSGVLALDKFGRAGLRVFAAEELGEE
jgi:hypothetical protein